MTHQKEPCPKCGAPTIRVTSGDDDRRVNAGHHHEGYLVIGENGFVQYSQAEHGTSVKRYIPHDLFCG